MIVKYLGESYVLSLIENKEYKVLSIEYGYYRVIDETGEDFLYDSDSFEIIKEGKVDVIDDDEGSLFCD